MPYSVLVQQLWPVADGAACFLRREWGIRNLKVEKAAYKEIRPLPTFHATMPDHHVLWMEVSNRCYPTHLDGVVADCMQHGFPVRLVVAVPEGSRGKIFHEDLARARVRGVGVIAISGNDGNILANPLSLSLAGVHPIPRSEFPPKFRYQLSQAEATFKGGNPAKGCDDLYSIVENVSRAVAKATHAASLWKPAASPPKNFETDPWNSVMEKFVNGLDFHRCKLFGDNILHRVIGVVPYRNKVVHFRDTAELQKRDKMLRTRFEDAANILLELVQDSKPLKV